MQLLRIKNKSFLLRKLEELIKFEVQNLNWGGRIRTYEWRSQSPQPYHLATPQDLRITKIRS